HVEDDGVGTVLVHTAQRGGPVTGHQHPETGQPQAPFHRDEHVLVVVDDEDGGQVVRVHADHCPGACGRGSPATPDGPAPRRAAPNRTAFDSAASAGETALPTAGLCRTGVIAGRSVVLAGGRDL